MAQGARQSSLFSAEDFSVVYESFSEANFQAYDYETIRNAMVDYINRNYPENYNDWINSCLLYTSPSPRDKRQSRMPSSA